MIEQVSISAALTTERSSHEQKLYQNFKNLWDQAQAFDKGFSKLKTPFASHPSTAGFRMREAIYCRKNFWKILSLEEESVSPQEGNRWRTGRILS